MNEQKVLQVQKKLQEKTKSRWVNDDSDDDFVIVSSVKEPHILVTNALQEKWWHIRVVSIMGTDVEASTADEVLKFARAAYKKLLDTKREAYKALTGKSI